MLRIGKILLIALYMGTILKWTVLGFHKDERYFCNGQCGVTKERCDCRESCKATKSCCTDYEQSCEGKKSWKDIECDQPENMICPDEYADLPPLVVLSIDGFRDIYIQRNLTPTIQKIARCGIQTSYMRSIYPTKTFSNHYSIATGLYAESHGIISNTIYDREKGMKFRMGKESSFDPYWWGGEPIWVTASNQGLKSATYFWPGGEVNNSRYPDYFKWYNQSVPLEERVYSLLEWLDMPQEDRPSVAMIYNHVVDSAGHKGGPFWEGLDRSLAQSDYMVEMIMNGFQQRNIHNCINFIIVSDHGMAPVNCTSKLVYLEEFGVNASDVSIDAGPFVRIGKSMDKSLWNNFNQSALKQQLECKRKYTHWEVFLKYEYMPKRYHFANNKWIEDLHLVMDDEWWAGVRNNPDCDAGGHGFDNAYADMRAFFAAHGSSFRTAYTRKIPFENIELYNLMTDLLGVIPAPNNGTKGSLYDMMVTPPVLRENTDLEKIQSCYSHLQPEEVSTTFSRCCENATAEDMPKQVLRFSVKTGLNVKDKSQFPFGTMIFQKDSTICYLPQEYFVTAFDKKMKLPILASMIIDNFSTFTADESAKCIALDHRVDDAMSFRCKNTLTSASNQLQWIPLIPLHTSACNPSSTLVPAYKPFVDVWHFMWKNILKWAKSFNGIAVQFGPIFDYDIDGHADTIEVLSKNATFVARGVGYLSPVPTHYYISAIKCKEYSVTIGIRQCLKSLKNVDVLNFIIPNYKKDPCHEDSEDIQDWAPPVISRHVARIKDIELLTGITFFSKWLPGKAPIDDVLLSIQTKLILPETTDQWLKMFILKSNY